MSSLIKLFIADIKLNFRNKQAIFWRLVFPIIFIVTFGLFNLDQAPTSKILIIDNANTLVSQNIVQGFEKVSFLKLEKSTISADLEKAKERLKDEKIDFILVLPETIKNLPVDVSIQATSITIESIKLELYYNEAKLATNQIVLNTLNQIIAQLNLSSLKAPEIFSLRTQALTNRRVRYIDFLVPGIVGMSLMTSAIIGIAVYLTEYREKKILRRILATPVNRKTFIFSQILSRLVLSVLQAVIIFATAKLIFNVNVYGNFLAIGTWVILASAVFLNIGFIIYSFSSTAAAAEGLSQIISMPMMFFSGVFFATDTLPAVVRMVVDRLPLAPVITALRKIIINGEGLASTQEQLILVIGWIVATSLFAFLRFRSVKE